MQLVKIPIESIEHETFKAILVNKNLWIPKVAILRKDIDNKYFIVKSWFLKGSKIKYEKLNWLDIVDKSKLKPLEQYINQQSSNYFPEKAIEHQQEVFNFTKGLKNVALFIDMGTPAGNSPEDLIGQFRFLTPDEFRMSDYGEITIFYGMDKLVEDVTDYTKPMIIELLTNEFKKVK